MAGKQVMISYRIADTGPKGKQGGDGTAPRIRDAIEAAGYTVFLDEAELEGGDKWNKVRWSGVGHKQQWCRRTSYQFSRRTYLSHACMSVCVVLYCR